MHSRLSCFAAVAMGWLVGACASSPPAASPAPSSPMPAPSVAIAQPDASASSAPAASTDLPGQVCGCGLCAPVVSNDACSTDADCAADAPCHALHCVGVAHAHPRTPGTMCTEIMMCNSIDANACGCVKGKCTLHAR